MIQNLFNKSIVIASALALFLSSCISENMLPTPYAEGYKTLSLHITQQPPYTRGESRPIPDGELLQFNTGNLYLVDAQGLVVRQYSIEDVPAHNFSARIISRSELGDFNATNPRTLTIPDVPGNVADVIIIGNTSHNAQLGERIIDIRSQHNAWNVNLFSRTIKPLTYNTVSSNWETNIYLAPTVARFEIAQITGTGSIAQFTVAGIFVDNFYSEARVNGNIITTSLVNGVNSADFVAGAGYFNDSPNYALFDTPILTGTRGSNLASVRPTTNNYVWSYQLFAQNNPTAPATRLPRIVIRLSGVRLLNEMGGMEAALPDYRYVTVRHFYENGVRLPENSARAGNVYRTSVVFDESDLGLIPGQVRSLPPPAAGMLIPFVGAFWRNNQRGERLIRMVHNGEWTAIVPVGMRNWIQIDREITTDRHIFTDSPADMTAHDASHRLPSTAGYSISGTGNICFRIGLRSFNNSGENPRYPLPRYGQVIIRYNNDQNERIIWIRQGEEADYVMHRIDDNRPAARRFSPFNLTVPSGADGRPNNALLNTNLELNGGGFVTYPTQTGAFFMWAGSHTRRAFAPVGGFGNTWGDGILGNWGNPDYLGNTHETCPVGFRRPNDGRIDGTAYIYQLYYRPNSEVRQSLFLNPPLGVANSTTNSVWGLYADGFFDRRPITNAAGATQISSLDANTVVANTNYIAHRGMLFFNPRNNASLFLPATGWRLSPDGVLNAVGNWGRYWNSTQGQGAAMGSCLEIGGGWAGLWGVDSRSTGYAIRCIAK